MSASQLKTITHPSFFDQNVRVSRERWAVTMVCNSTSCRMKVYSQNFLSATNHAILVVESVKKTGILLRQIIDFRGVDSVKAHNGVAFFGYCCFLGKLRIGEVVVTPDHKDFIKYTHKSETWLRSADKVRKLRREAKNERDNPSEFPRPFSILGNRSFLLLI